jgi:hypothetical protein
MSANSAENVCKLLPGGLQISKVAPVETVKVRAGSSSFQISRLPVARLPDVQQNRRSSATRSDGSSSRSSMHIDVESNNSAEERMTSFLNLTPIPQVEKVLVPFQNGNKKISTNVVRLTGNQFLQPSAKFPKVLVDLTDEINDHQMALTASQIKSELPLKVERRDDFLKNFASFSTQKNETTNPVTSGSSKMVKISFREASTPKIVVRTVSPVVIDVDSDLDSSIEVKEEPNDEEVNSQLENGPKQKEIEANTGTDDVVQNAADNADAETTEIDSGLDTENNTSGSNGDEADPVEEVLNQLIEKVSGAQKPNIKEQTESKEVKSVLSKVAVSIKRQSTETNMAKIETGKKIKLANETENVDNQIKLKESEKKWETLPAGPSSTTAASSSTTEMNLPKRKSQRPSRFRASEETMSLPKLSDLVTKATFDCKQCQLKFTDSSILAKHNQFVHAGSSGSPGMSGLSGFVHAGSSGFVKDGSSGSSGFVKDGSTGPSGTTGHKCLKCKMSFFTENILKEHISRVHPNDIVFIICKICDKKFMNRRDLKKHFSAVHKTKPCNICGIKFCWDDKLSAHIRSEHSDVNLLISENVTKNESKSDLKRSLSTSDDVDGIDVNASFKRLKMDDGRENQICNFACRLCDKTFTQLCNMVII